MFWSIEQYYNRVHFAVVRRLRVVERHLVRIQRPYKRRFRIAFPGLVSEIEKAFREHVWLRRHAHSLFYAMFGILLLASQVVFPSSVTTTRQDAHDTAEPEQRAGTSETLKSHRDAVLKPMPALAPGKADAAP
jgi:hypothetical protein